MKKIKILKVSDNTNLLSPRYRGLERVQPYYVGTVKEDHVVNKLFIQYLETSNDIGILEDDNLAREVIEAYAALNPPVIFEAVQVVGIDELEQTGDILGIDIVHGMSRSCLVSGPLNVNIEEIEENHDEMIDRLAPLILLSKHYFADQINEFFLFRDAASASLYLNVYNALQYFRPGLWEGDDAIFKPVGLRVAYELE